MPIENAPERVQYFAHRLDQLAAKHVTRKHQILHGVTVTRRKSEAAALGRVLAATHHEKHVRHFVLGYYVRIAVSAVRLVRVTTIEQNDLFVYGLRHGHGHFYAHFALLVQRRHDAVYFGLGLRRVHRRATQVSNAIKEYAIG